MPRALSWYEEEEEGVARGQSSSRGPCSCPLHGVSDGLRGESTSRVLESHHSLQSLFTCAKPLYIQCLHVQAMLFYIISASFS